MVGQMHRCMVKISYMLKINDEAAVCLEKTVFGKQFCPVIHILNRNKILRGGMNNDLSSLCFYFNNLLGSKNIGNLFVLNRNFDSFGIKINQTIFHIPKKTAEIKWFGKITKYMKTHGIIQIFRV